MHSHNQNPAKEFYVIFGEICNNADGEPFVGTKGTVGGFDIIKL